MASDTERNSVSVQHTMEQDIPGTEKIYTLGEEGIILIPPPTDSPNDPLNWSSPRKYWHTFLVCFVTGLTAATANDAASAQDGMNTDLGIGFDIMNDAAGVLFIGIGYFTLFLAPVTTLYGRRIGYLTCIFLGLIGAVWFSQVNNAGSSIGNQLFVGMSEACAEALVQLSLMDIWFSHQTGTSLSIYILATSIGTYLGPLIGGFVADSLGWRWVGYLSVIISAGTLVLFYFGLEETYFDHEQYGAGNFIIEGVNNRNSPDCEEKPHIDHKQEKKPWGNALVARPPKARNPAVVEEKRTYWQRIALITPCTNLEGYGTKQYFQRLWHGMRVFAFPAVWFSGLLWGSQDAWLTFYLTTEDDDWYGPPWNYGDRGVALMNLPCLIGAIIGCLYAGPLSDWFVMWMARRNGGVKEAETRLWFGLANLIISPAGLIIFGVGTGQGWSWGRPYLGLGFIGFGWGCSGDIAMSYLVDCYPDMVLEGMVGVAVINNTLGMIFTFACESWLTASGVQNTYIAIGVLEFVFVLTSVPLIIYGKRIRIWTAPSYKKFLELRDG